MARHIDKFHHTVSDELNIFDLMEQKINQFSDGFSVF
jgi:hemerythrin-like domain-containing protein